MEPQGHRCGMADLRVRVRHVDLEHQLLEAGLASLDDQLPRDQHVALLAFVEGFGGAEARRAVRERDSRMIYPERDIDRGVTLTENEGTGALRPALELLSLSAQVERGGEAEEADDGRRSVHG